MRELWGGFCEPYLGFCAFCDMFFIIRYFNSENQSKEYDIPLQIQKLQDLTRKSAKTPHNTTKISIYVIYTSKSPTKLKTYD